MEAKMEAKMKDKPKKEAPTLCGSPNGKSCVGALGWSTPTQPNRKIRVLPQRPNGNLQPCPYPNPTLHSSVKNNPSKTFGPSKSTTAKKIKVFSTQIFIVPLKKTCTVFM